MTRPASPTRLALAAMALTLVAGLAACGSSGGDKASTTGSSTTTSAAKTTTTAAATTSTTEAPTTSTTENNEGTDTETSELDTLPDGDHYGYMAGHEMGKVEGQDVEVIIWDEVQFLTGQEAIDAASEDGVTLDTDYYVRNENQTVRRLAVVPDASVTSLKEGSPDPVPSSVSDVWQQPYLFKINVGNVRGITTVSSIEAVFLP